MEKSSRNLLVSVVFAGLALGLLGLAVFFLLEGREICARGRRWVTKGNCSLTADVRLKWDGAIEPETAAMGHLTWPKPLLYATGGGLLSTALVALAIPGLEALRILGCLRCSAKRSRTLHLGLLVLKSLLAIATATGGLSAANSALSAFYCLTLHPHMCRSAYFTVWSYVYGSLACLAVFVLGLVELLLFWCCLGGEEEEDSLTPRSRALQAKVKYYQSRLQTFELEVPLNSDELSELPDFSTCSTQDSEENTPAASSTLTPSPHPVHEEEEEEEDA